jgi:hypothetical protein
MTTHQLALLQPDSPLRRKRSVLWCIQNQRCIEHNDRHGTPFDDGSRAPYCPTCKRARFKVLRAKGLYP